MNLMKTTYTIALLVLVFSISASAKEQPIGHFVWNSLGQKDGASVELEKSHIKIDGEIVQYSGSLESEVSPLGTVQWVFLEDTEYFGDIIVIKIIAEDGGEFRTFIKNGDYGLIYSDESMAISYTKNAGGL